MLGFDRWQMFKALAAILCIAGVAWLALAYLIPTPPSKIAIATSLPGDHYQVLGTRYQGILAGSSVELEVEYDLPLGFLGEIADKLVVERKNEDEAETILQRLKELCERS